MSAIGIARETLPAAPKYRINELVHYIDHHNRTQDGHVRWIEAKWIGYGHGDVTPHLMYALWHPTYRNKIFYAGEDSILRPLNKRELEGYRYA